MGNAKEISHFHRHIIQINLSKLEKTLTNSLINFEQFTPKVTGLTLLRNQFDHLLTEAEDNLHKITRRHKQKRGLFNFLGTTIKYITGNPDNSDLELLKTHITSLELKENEIIKKYNNQISYSETFNNRFDMLLDKINNNNLVIKNVVDDISQQLVIINEILEMQSINEYIKKLIRTITFSQLNLTNIELFTFKELKILQENLISLYSRDALVINDEHPYELLESSHSIVCVTQKKMLIILKLPILHVHSYPLIKVYPLPNDDHAMIIPPARYYSNNSWYEACTQKSNFVICQNRIHSKCQIPNVQTCAVAHVSENFVQETDNAILLGIVEPLTIAKTTVSRSSFIIYNETLDVLGQRFLPRTLQEIQSPNIVQLKLEPQHVLKLEKLDIPRTHGQIQPIETLSLQPQISTGLSILSCILITFVTAFTCYILIRKRHRIAKLLFSPRIQPHQALALQELLESSRTKTSPKEGGETLA